MCARVKGNPEKDLYTYAPQHPHIRTKTHQCMGTHADLHTVVIKLSIFLRVRGVTQESRAEMMM